MRRIRFALVSALNRRNFHVPGGQRDMWAIGIARLYTAHEGPRVVEFLSTLNADLVRPSLNGKHTTQVAVTAAAVNKLENPK